MKPLIQILSKRGDGLSLNSFYSAESAALFCWGQDMSRMTFFYRGQPIPGDLPCDITALERFLESHANKTDGVCENCTHWRRSRAASTTGYCELFGNTTHALHGNECTAYEP